MNPKRLAVAFDNLVERSLERTLIVGRLGLPDGTIDVPGRTGYVYVSKGDSGELGHATAIDRVGVASVANQKVWMRREHNQLIVYDAEQYAGTTTYDTLSGLTDVELTSLADGEGLVWDSGTSKWINATLSGGAGAPSPHARDSAHHTGLEAWSNIDLSTSDLADLAARSHADLTNVTANQHHNQVHTLVGSDHTATGLTTGHVVRASGSASFAWAELQHDDLGGVTANQHHNQIHDITGSDHTITGSAFDVVGATATDTLGIITPSSNPGAAAKLLRTASDGSLQLDTNLLYVDAPNNRLGVNQTPGNAALDVIASANADHTQRLKQKSGQTGRLWRIEDTAGDELIVLDSQGNLQSGKPGFVSGLTGWQITPTCTAEFNNVWVRGELHATIFVKDEVHVSGGTLLVATGAKLYSDADIDSTTVDEVALEFETSSGVVTWQFDTASGLVDAEIESILNYIEVEDSPTGAGFYFDVGEIVRSKTEVETGVTDFWFEIASKTQLDGYQRYSVLKRSGTDGVLPAGAALASYGVEGDGRILLTSDLNYAPYMDVFTIGPEVWTGAAGSVVPRVRLGRLDGVGVTAVSGIEQYGIIMGTDLSNANSPYIVASNLQLRLHKVDLTLNDGTNDTGEWDSSGNLTIGTNIAQTARKSFSVITTGTDAGDVLIGDHTLAGNYLHWDAGGTLTINGALKVGGANVATQTYVDTAESDAVSTANSYTDSATAAAITSANTYANGRRVLGVDGTWAAVDNNTISWTSASVRLGSGTTKSITNGNTGNMTTVSYLYVDPDAAAPLTISVTTSLGSLPAGYTLIAVCYPGIEKASVAIVAGATYISGDHIATNSISANQIKAATITANEIAAGAVTATKINVSELEAVSTDTGDLTVSGNITLGTSGAIFTSGKTSASDTTAGFFLGYDTGQYQFRVGDADNYLWWSGSNLSLRTIVPPTFDASSDATDRAIILQNGIDTMAFAYTPGALAIDPTENTTVSARKFIVTNDTFQIETMREPATSGALGFAGEICWGTNYLYIHNGTAWRRIAHSAW